GDSGSAGHDGRWRRRLGRRAVEVRSRRPCHPRVDRRRRCPGTARGQAAARRGGAPVTRAPFIAANWKMYKTVTEALAFVDALPARAGAPDGVDVALCAPFTDLPALVERAAGSGIAIYAQNMHWEDSGAYTGEVSPPMLAELAVDGVILGHSERRALFAETDSALARKLPAALDAGLHPILCVGETEQERERGETDRKLRRQVEEDLVG